MLDGRCGDDPWLQMFVSLAKPPTTRPGKLTVCDIEHGHRNSGFSH